MPDDLVITPGDQASLGDIIELGLATGRTWQKNNLAAITGAPPAASGTGDIGPGVADTPFAYVAPDGSGRVVYRDGDIDSTGDVIELWLAPGAGTWQWDSLTAITGAPQARASAGRRPFAYVTPDNVARVLYGDSNGGITELRLTPGAGTWQQDSLTAIARSAPFAYVTPDGAARVLYDDGSGLTELRLAPGAGIWQQANLTAITGAPPPAGDPFAYVTPDGAARVVYRTLPPFVPPPPGQPSPPSRVDIIELRLTSDAGTWQQANLTAITGAPPPAGDPVAYVAPDGSGRVVYQDDNGGITELWLAPGAGTWQQDSLTAITGAPPPARDPVAYVAPDGSARVVYQDSNSGITELWLAPGAGTWQQDSLTAITGAPPAASAPFAYVTPDKVARVYYSSLPS